VRVITVTYGYTFQPQQYQAERIEMTAELESGDRAMEVLQTLRQAVHDGYEAIHAVAGAPDNRVAPPPQAAAKPAPYRASR
jgi:hypothetical protein